MNNKRSKINIFKKLVVVGITCATVLTGFYNFVVDATLIAFAKGHVEKNVLTQKDVQNLLQDPNVVFEGPNGKVFKIPGKFTEIGDCAFLGCNDFTEIRLSDGVIKIGVKAFWNCVRLEKIDIPSSVEEIEAGAFMMCKNLKRIIVPERVKEINEATFQCCSNLIEVEILGSIAKIGNSAFGYCERLAKITIPSSLTEIAEWAFNECKGLKQIMIPASVTKIREGAFWGCSSLTEITIPENVIELGKGAFYGCKKLVKIIFLPHLKQIPQNAFGECTSLKYIIPANEEKIISEEEPLINAQGAIISSRINDFGPSCLASCTDLKTIELLTDEISFKENCFYGCNNLHLASFPNAKEVKLKKLGLPKNFNNRFSLFVPAGCVVTKELNS